MPPKKDIKKKKKPLKQKQKQKQIVKQNVRVNVQSSGGSGAGGTSVPSLAPSPIPYNYFDRTGENVQIRNLVEEAVRRQAIPRVVQLPADVPISQPANDATTFNAVYNAPSDLDRPLVAGKGAVGESKKGRPVGSKNKPKIIAYPVESGGYPSFLVESGTESEYTRAGSPPSMMGLGFQEPVGFPARSRYLAELEAKQKMGGM
jgi:hypothetical protein